MGPEYCHPPTVSRGDVAIICPSLRSGGRPGWQYRRYTAVELGRQAGADGVAQPVAARKRPSAWLGQIVFGPAEQSRAEHGGLDGEPLCGIGGVVAGERPNSVEPVGDRADR